MKPILLLLLASPLLTLAQKPVSATMTKPGNQTFSVPHNPKIPPLNLPCKMSNGKDRPFACEFRFDKLEMLGKGGAVLATVTAKNSTVSLPASQAKKAATTNGQATITYPAKAYFTRVNPPALAVNKGYLIQRSSGAFGTAGGTVNTLLAGVAINTSVGTKTALSFDLTWPHNADGTALFEVLIENDVTTGQIKSVGGPAQAQIMRDKAEAFLVVNPKLTKP